MQEFTNEVINLEQLPQYESVHLTAPHRSYRIIIAINISCLFALSLIGLIILQQVNEEAASYWVIILSGFVIFFALLYILYFLSFKKRGYALREKDILYRNGLIAEKTTIIPLNRIQHVALKEGLFSRMFKLATLEIHTAGGASGHLHIAGIPIEQAKTIKEGLLKKIDTLEKALSEE
ncbi:Bacterial PH domain protein [compost metagenome]